jgi:hypothetical protein
MAARSLSPRAPLLIGALVIAACSQRAKPVPGVVPATDRATTAIPQPPPVRDAVYGLVSARWDGQDHVVVLAEAARRAPTGEPTVQTHQRAGHEHPSYPRVADITPSTRDVFTLVYPDSPTCIARVTHALLWAGPMGMAWREAFALEGCPDGAALAVDGEAPGLTFAAPFDWVEPRSSFASAVAPLAIRSALGDGEITMIEAGGTADGIGGTAFVFRGDDLVFWQPRTRPWRVLRDGDWLVVELLEWNHGTRLVPMDLAPSKDARACRTRCSAVDHACDERARAAAVAPDDDREPLASCTAAFIECAAACPI